MDISMENNMDGKTLTIIIISVIVALCVGVIIGSFVIAAPAGTTPKGADNSTIPESGLTVSETGNISTLTLNKGTVFTIRLDENPTTGYSWNASVTSGLTVLNSTYVSGGSGLMGAGGVHEWKIEATGTGAQQFNAVYERPWEKLGNETQYQLIVNVA
jgi:inhibitor of cysteine peptidase